MRYVTDKHTIRYDRRV